MYGFIAFTYTFSLVWILVYKTHWKSMCLSKWSSNIDSLPPLQNILVCATLQPLILFDFLFKYPEITLQQSGGASLAVVIESGAQSFIHPTLWHSPHKKYHHIIDGARPIISLFQSSVPNVQILTVEEHRSETMLQWTFAVLDPDHFF